MTEVSPPKPVEGNPDAGRMVALGGLRRVFKSRQQRNSRKLTKQRQETEDAGGDVDESDDEGEELAPLTQNTSNHYTLNMPAHPAPPSDLPYILLGFVLYL